MLALIFWVMVALFFLIFLVVLMIFPFKMAAAKPFECPSCDRKLRLITKSAKCPHCKTKLFKHVSGEYRASV